MGKLNTDLRDEEVLVLARAAQNIDYVVSALVKLERWRECAQAAAELPVHSEAESLLSILALLDGSVPSLSASPSLSSTTPSSSSSSSSSSLALASLSASSSVSPPTAESREHFLATFVVAAKVACMWAAT